MYLQFLLLANEPKTVIANRWEILDNGKMHANVIYQNGVCVIQKDAEFDFIHDKKSRILLSGYSRKLKSNVVVSPFNIRHQCLLLGINDTVEKNIWKGSFSTKEETKQKVKLIQKLL